MPLYDSDHPAVPAMKGLHLFHFVLSNCSQRVRLGLEEKGLEWESHHLNLPANEHVSEDYQRINPHGVVPTLVHDGQVVIESNDILAYLDEHFPGPRLRPDDAEEAACMQRAIEAASAAQSAIKVLSHDLLFRPFRKIGDEELALYEAKAADKGLVAFLRDFAENGSAWRDRVERGRAEMDAALGDLEATLGAQPWLSGSAYGLADISWIVNAHRLEQAHYPLEGYPRVRDWADRARTRSSFERAVVGWRP